MLRKITLSFLLLVMSFGAIFTISSNQNVFAQDETVDEYDYNYDDSWDTYGDDTYNYDYSYGSSDELSDGEAAAVLGVFAAFWGVFACIGLALYIYSALTLSTIGKKVGEENTWMAWVPIANLFFLFQVAGLNIWLALLFFVPFVNIVAMFLSIYAWMKIAERRGFESWMGLLLLVPVVGVFIPGYIAWGEGNGGSAKPEEKTNPM